MKIAIALLVMMVGVVGQGQTNATKTVPAHIEWNGNGSYLCEGKGFCRTPTEAEIAAHKPKPRVKKSKTVKPTVSPKPLLGDETDGYQVKAEVASQSVAKLLPMCKEGQTSDKDKCVEFPAIIGARLELSLQQWAAFAANWHLRPCPLVGPNESCVDTSNLSITSATGRIDLLSDEEYKELQEMSKQIALLRVKQEMAKIRIAKAHGVEVMPELRPCPPDCFTTGDIKLYEHWEIHGQFLEVNVPTEAK